MRLEKPRFCPPPIATLLDKCFSELPEKRPTFQEIKSDLDSAYNCLRVQPQLNGKIKDEENPQMGHLPGITLIENSMKMRYTAMIKGNKEQMKRNDSLGRKSNQYLNMRKLVSCNNSVTLECEVDFIAKNDTHNHLKIGHANKCQSHNTLGVKAIKRNQSFNDIILKEEPKNKLKRSHSEPKISILI